MTFESYGRTIERNAKPILICVVLLVIAAIVGIAKVDIDTRFSLFAPKNSRYSQAGDLVREAFGDSEQLMLLVPIENTADSFRGVGVLAGLLEEVGGVMRVIGSIPSDMADESDETIFDLVRSLPSGEGISAIIERDAGTWALVRVQLEADIEIRKTVGGILSIVEAFAPETVVSGEPYLETQMFDYILKILIILPPAAIVLILGIFRIRIGSFRATMLSMVPAGIGAVITLGALSWTRGTISALSVLVPVYVIVLGSADGLHITSHVMDELGNGRANKQAILNTLEAVGVPIILTTLTTMAGFLSLFMIGSPAIREMAVTASVGMLIAGLVTWIVLPILLLHQKPLPSRNRNKSDIVSGTLWRLRGWPSFVLTALILIAAIPGALRLTADFSMLDMYKVRTEVRKSIEAVSEITGGAFPLSVLAGPIDLFDTGTARNMLDLQNRLHDEGLTTTELSVFSLIGAASRRLPGTADYPESPALARFLATQIENVVPDLYKTLVSDSGWIRVLLYVDDLQTSTLSSVAEIIEETAEATGIPLFPSSSAFEIMDMNRVIIPQQLRSMGLALLLVVVLTAVFLKSVESGLKAAVPIVVTLVGLYGVMGYCGIDLSIVTSIMSGLSIGVGIDYAIHYTSAFRFLKRKNIDNPSHSAVSYVATPVLANAIGLSVGFTAMAFSPLQTHVSLSILMWVTMVLSAMLSLSLLPTLLGARRGG